MTTLFNCPKCGTVMESPTVEIMNLDAARYRWLRAHFTQLCIRTEVYDPRHAHIANITISRGMLAPDEPSVDAAIDAAMKAVP